MQENKSTESRLADVEKKLGEKKKDVWEIIGIVSTILTPVLLALLAYFFNERSKKDEQKQLSIQNVRDEVFKKTELLEKFGPYLYDTSSLKNKIAIIGMYTIDTSFALQLATIINSPGTQSAIKALFKSADSAQQTPLEKILVNTQERRVAPPIDSMTPGGMALQRALEEWQAGAKEVPANSNSGPFVKKYFASIGLDMDAPWSTAFVAWCFLSNPSLQNKLSFLKTPSPNQLYANMQQKGLIHSPNEVPEPGDIVFLQRETNGVMHTGLVQSSENDIVYTVEGNVSVDPTDNGGAVLKRARKKDMISAFGRIKAIQ